MSRVHTLPRSDKFSQVKGWIRGNTKIGPVLDVAVSYHQGRYGVEIMINSFFGDGTRSRVMMVNGINKHVTEMSEETQENHIHDIEDGTGKPVAKARPKHINTDDFFNDYVTIRPPWLDGCGARSV